MNRARGGLAQLSCQSDFVGRTDEFKKLVEDVTHSLSFLVDANGFKDVDIASGVLDAPLIASSPDSTPATTSNQSIQDAITSTIAKVGENITLKRFTAFNLPGAKSEQSPIRALGQFTHSTQPNSQINSNSPVQLGLLAALVDLEVSGSANQDAVNQLSRKIARQSVAMDCDTVEQLEEQELLGGVDAQTVKAYLDEWTAQNQLENAVITNTVHNRIILVAVLWVFSYEITDKLFEIGYKKPFLLTYLSSAAFTPYLIPYLLWHKVPNQNQLNPSQTLNLAYKFTFYWILANFSINASLQFTSVASSTILSSTSGLWTFLLGCLVSVESFEFTKLLAVFASIVGSVLVALDDVHGVDHVFNALSILGDSLALLSAVSFSVYILLLKKAVGSESNIDFPLFLGYIGVINTVCFWPILVILHYTGIETFQVPDNSTVLIILGLNMLITFSSDYLYLQAMLKTTPLVATIGISLCLPFSILSDWWMGQLHLTAYGLLGSVFVLGSFIVLGYEEDEVETEPGLIGESDVQRNYDSISQS
ncbi:hypothetical protein E3P99_03328 [Wallemia hederae]|uniref:EamA domain-containing protein n=1 Tax=Wallemia hederae TaxID=1540922 RepID=A0A4T0FFX5_9BASI|nr:hypothetical protein E3P99_03328 [Wallemia hederae]